MGSKAKWIIIIVVALILIITAIFFMTKRGKTDIIVDASIPRINVTSPSFVDLGVMPDKHTGRGEDVSPAMELSELAQGAVSIAIIMDDLDIPVRANYTHWVIWNIPAGSHIPEGISDGIQGIAYGRNRYKGPLPPFGTHRYQFHVFVLDTTLDLDSSCGKGDLIDAMQGHILQYGTLTGWYPREAK